MHIAVFCSVALPRNKEIAEVAAPQQTPQKD